MSNILAASVLLSIISMLVGPVATRTPGHKASQGQKCESPVYSSNEVSRRAKITSMPDLQLTEEFRVKQSKGRAQLTAVLCKTGEVTAIEIIKGLPNGMGEKLIEAVQGVKFTPAEKDGEAVSQRQRFEFIIN